MQLPHKPSAPTLSLALALAAAWPAGFALPAKAADITTASRLDAVIVYRAGAEVTRVVSPEIEAGAHALVIKDLPAEAIPSSIRVEGRADGALRIGAVDAKRVSVLTGDAKVQGAARRELEDELEKLTDGMAQLRAEIETREAQKLFITNLASLPNQPPSRNNGPSEQDWPKLLELIGASMADVQSAILKAQIAMRALGLKIDDTKKKLAELAPRQEQRTEVRINVEADAKLKADLIIRYQVRNASWRPNYDARLDTGTAEKAAGLILTRRATIQQYTGEAWRDVALKLSTSQPGSRSAAPDLHTMTVDFARPAEPRPMAALESRKQFAGRARLEAPAPAAVAKAKSEEATDALQRRDVAEVAGALEQSAFQARFAVPGRVTILNTGEAKRVKLDDQAIAPRLSIRTVPRRDTNAYLYAGLEMPKTAPYLAGPVSLFRDGGFVGTGQLPNLAPGADHELGFGNDPSVVVKYHIEGEKRGESGIISSSTTDQRNFKIEIANQHPRKIDVVLIDQMPVPLNEDITVNLIGASAPTKRNFDDKRGLLAWQFALDPAQKRTVSFGYTIAWPAGKTVDFGYGR